MRKKLSRDDALAMLEGLTAEQRLEYEAIKAARDRVRATGKVSRAAVREAAGCGNDSVVFYMRILEAIEAVDDESRVDHAPGATAPLHPIIASVIADAKALNERLETAVGTVLDDAVRQEHERTRQRLEARIGATEGALAEMADRSLDFEEAADDLAVTCLAHKANVASLEAQLAQVKESNANLSKQVDAAAVRTAELSGRLENALDHNLNLKSVNALLNTEVERAGSELENVKADRDALKAEAVQVRQLHTDIALIREQRDAYLRENIQHVSMIDRMRDQHEREVGDLRQDYQRQLAAERDRIIHLETGIVDALKSLGKPQPAQARAS